MVARAGLALVLVAAAACGGRPIHPWEYRPRAMADTIPVHEPEARETSLAYDQIYGAFTGMGRAVNLNRHLGGLPPALNADPFDEVVDSAWFTNRNHARALAPDEVARGPQSTRGPDLAGPLTVKSIKAEGITPGFNVKDARGDTYVLKFDPPENPEMASAAEVIATNLFWAAGYHVPQNYILHFDPSRLVFDEDLELDALEGDEVVTYRVGADDPAEELTLEVFQRHILAGYPRLADGTVRAMASKFLEGKPKGPFGWEETREDDPNDVIAHEHRRENRGLYVIAAWLNHVDTKQGNTEDFFIESEASPEGDDAPKIGYLRHNLLDFGSTLGSGAARPHNPRHGDEYDFDAGAVLLRFLTLGLYKRPWQRLEERPTHPSTGYYSAEIFNPADWRPNIVNPAFINRTPRDGYWGAKIVMSFTDEQLAAVVGAGQYSDPAAAAYVLKGLRERRDATGRHWFRQVTPLDEPRIEGRALAFDDLWTRYFGEAGSYRWELEWSAVGLRDRGESSGPRIALPVPTGPVPEADGERAHARLRVWRSDPALAGRWAPRPATIWLAWDAAAGSWRVAGVRY